MRLTPHPPAAFHRCLHRCLTASADGLQCEAAARLDKGQTKWGLIIFEVPKSVKADTLRFHIGAPVGAEDSIEIKLK
jgi:hypothetical protein